MTAKPLPLSPLDKTPFSKGLSSLLPLSPPSEPIFSSPRRMPPSSTAPLLCTPSFLRHLLPSGGVQGLCRSGSGGCSPAGLWRRLREGLRDGAGAGRHTRAVHVSPRALAPLPSTGPPLLTPIPSPLDISLHCLASGFVTSHVLFTCTHALTPTPNAPPPGPPSSSSLPRTLLSSQTLPQKSRLHATTT